MADVTVNFDLPIFGVATSFSLERAVSTITVLLEIGIPVCQLGKIGILYSVSQQRSITLQILTVPGSATSNESTMKNLSLCAYLFKDPNPNTQEDCSELLQVWFMLPQMILS